jgi:hypothetical protein
MIQMTVRNDHHGNVAILKLLQKFTITVSTYKLHAQIDAQHLISLSDSLNLCTYPEKMY